MSSRILRLQLLSNQVFHCGVLFGLASCIASNVANGELPTAQVRDADGSVAQDSTETAEPVEINAATEDDKLEVLSDAEQAAALRKRGRANVLGMDLDEGPNHRATVVEVTAASPAFDAGIREGDVIVSFDGFAAKTYREWIDGIRRMVADAPDGATVAVEVVRNGKRVAANIRTLESTVNDPLLPNLLNPMQTQGGTSGAAVPSPGSANQPVGALPGGNIFINNAPFNDAFGAELSPAIERAMAEIVRLDEQQQSPASGGVSGVSAAGAQPGAVQQPGSRGEQTAGVAGGAPSGSESRIGVAGFRDTEDGMLVMVDVGGLEPGNYRVSVEDPSFMLGRGNDATGQRTATGTPETAIPENNAPEPNESNAPPSDTATPPTGQVNPSSTPATGQVNPPATPPSGRVLPQQTPAAGRALPSGTATVGLPADDERVAGSNAANRPADPIGQGRRLGTLSHIGVLTVDQSGTGRLQQVVETVHVRDVLGQAIMIHPPSQPPERTLPTNPTDGGAAGVESASSNIAGSQLSTRAARPQTHNAQPSAPVAAGMIRLLPDRRPASNPLAAPAGSPRTQPQLGESQLPIQDEVDVSQLPPSGQEQQPR
jgi:hypothetical protein